MGRPAHESSTTTSLWSVVAATHTGVVRSRNEDTIAAGPWVCCDALARPCTLRFELGPGERLPCVVCDGLGGHAGGQIASLLVARSLIGDLWGDGKPRRELLQQAADGLRSANRMVYMQMEADPDLESMGSTAAGVLIEADRLAIFNVGDSRVYRWEEHVLTQLTYDDVPPSEVRTGLVLQSLGGAPEYVEIQPHVLEERWLPGRRYLLCTDGVYEALTLDALEAALKLEPYAAVTQMVDNALAAGAPDNLSILLIDRS